ncbi:MAG: putative zinc-binding protein [Desulfobacterales bacterium]
MILACSGGSNVGQIANQAAVELTQEKFGTMYCLAGIGGGLQGFIQSAKDVPVIVAVDGCAVGCARATLKRAGIDSFQHIVLTELGIEKNKNFQLNPEDVRRAKEAVRAARPNADAADFRAAHGCCNR